MTGHATALADAHQAAESAGLRPIRPLRIALWPGRSGAGNVFIDRVVEGLEANGATVCRVDDPLALSWFETDVFVMNWAHAILFGYHRRRDLIARPLRLLWHLWRRPRHVRVIWIVHELSPHQSTRLIDLIWKPYVAGLLRTVDGIVTLAEETMTVVKSAYPAAAGRPFGWFPHPAYPDVPKTGAERAALRAERGFSPEAMVLGYCGALKHYKGIDILAGVFARTSGDGLNLLIAGPPVEAAVAETVREEAAADPRIRLAIGELPPDAYVDAVSSCDVIVAPFRSYLHSGTLIHALSLGVAVLTPATPFARSLQNLAGHDWVQTYDGALTPAVLQGVRRPAARAPDLSALDVKEVGRRLLAFCEKVSRDA